MRDALSMLDKIVSFTNGEVNYQHTLEHLNILDADYYFKLMDCMLSQDLAGAMLLFDDIMRKGFDEELVLGGMSEFIRNVLVAKDERIAGVAGCCRKLQREIYFYGEKNRCRIFGKRAEYSQRNRDQL